MVRSLIHKALCCRATWASTAEKCSICAELGTLFSSKNAAVILICRSGIRSVAAAEAAIKAGFSQVFYVQEGIEGNATNQQITVGGWRYWDLPVVHA